MTIYTDKYIEQLLEKFMNGESTLKEEKQLGEYFRGQTVRAEWEDYRKMFAYFDGGMQEDGLPDVADADGMVVTEKTEKPPVTVSVGILAAGGIRKYWRWMAAAACIVFVCCITDLYFLYGNGAIGTERMEAACTEVPVGKSMEPQQLARVKAESDRSSAKTALKKDVNSTEHASKKNHSVVDKAFAEKEASLEDVMQMEMDMVAAYGEIDRLSSEMAAGYDDLAGIVEDCYRIQHEVGEVFSCNNIE